RARCDGWAAVGHLRSIRLGQADVLIGQAESLGRNLAQNRFRSLAKFRARNQHPDTAVSAAFHSDYGTQIALARSGESRAVQKRGNPYALPGCAHAISVCEALLLGIIVRKLQGAVEQLPEIDRFAHDLLRCS